MHASGERCWYVLTSSSPAPAPSPAGLPGEDERKPLKTGAAGPAGTALKGKAGAWSTGDLAAVASGSNTDTEGRCSLRGLVWKVLLGTIHTDAVLYIRLVGRGPSSEDVKIREDTFRTFHGDEEFRRRVPEDKLSRINNAFVRLNSPSEAMLDARASRGADGVASGVSGSGNGHTGSGDGDRWDEPEAADTGESKVAPGRGGVRGEGKGLYVQGMMVLCAPLLFVMPEVDAFYCFNSLLNQHMPRRDRARVPLLY